MAVFISRLSRSARRYLYVRFYSSKVPEKPTWETIDPEQMPKETAIDQNTIDLLERLSLVDFNNKAGIERLSHAVRFADQLFLVNTEGVEPMDSVLEDRPLYLRTDMVSDGNKQKEILQHAKVIEEDYYVAPPGNIPLEKTKRPYKEKDEKS